MTNIAAITILSVLFTSSKAFSIGALPATVTAGQVESLTWMRSESDPTCFLLGKTSAAKNMLGEISPTVSVRMEQTQGILPVTFNNAQIQVTIVAYDLDHSKEPPFYIDSNPIEILSPIPTSSANLTQSISIIDRNGATPSRGTSGTSISQPTPTTSSMEATSPQTRQRSRRSAAIAGGVVGGVFGLAIIITSAFLILKRRKKKLVHGEYSLTPFYDTTGSDITHTDTSQVIGRKSPVRQPQASEQEPGSNRLGDDTIQGCQAKILLVIERNSFPFVYEFPFLVMDSEPST
ncbi:hypothetical protein E1B28_013100 [Marasmius oreades]|uniref:Epidermal growth factor receptor-like transmembrane-juxtamembrane segment domain-containing protein n=1 Tax=Marasmius oreades TaxID=181124 RepID=A0A9P7RNX1_9AGAR|nr:uncharacterized protein E1B28_013100 [Marasmius oreades]KAG7087119.1 hypothetical protein E1B28_013100 [Marasmius oreades]